MKAFLISLVCSTSVLCSCAHNEKTLLEERAGYEEKAPHLGSDGGGDVRYVPKRVPEKVVVAWLYAHELPSKDYFWGSWLSIVVSQEAWEMSKVEVPISSKEKMKTPPRPKTSAPKKVKPKQST